MLKLAAATSDDKNSWIEHLSKLVGTCESSTLPGKKTGWLQKEGSLFKTWKRRWFILNENNNLDYYESQSVCKFVFAQLSFPSLWFIFIFIKRPSHFFRCFPPLVSSFWFLQQFRTVFRKVLLKWKQLFHQKKISIHCWRESRGKTSILCLLLLSMHCWKDCAIHHSKWTSLVPLHHFEY